MTITVYCTFFCLCSLNDISLFAIEKLSKVFHVKSYYLVNCTVFNCLKKLGINVVLHNKNEIQVFLQYSLKLLKNNVRKYES